MNQNNNTEVPISEQGEVLGILHKLRQLSRASKLWILQECSIDDEEEIVIPHPNNKFVFPLPIGAIGKDGIPAKWTNLNDPPFYNREQTLLRLLWDCYTNFTRTNQIKPLVAVIATSPGYGKTRLLLEWAIRVFHTPRVLQAFIDDKTTSPLQEEQRTFEQLAHEIKTAAFNTALSVAKSERLKFLVNLHETLSRSMILSASVSWFQIDQSILEKPQDENSVFNATDLLCRTIVISNICSRFVGKNTINGSEIVIPTTWNPAKDEDRKWLSDNNLLKPVLQQPKYDVFFSLIDLFIELVNQTTQGYKSTNIGLNLKGQLLLVNIDEAGTILKIDALKRVLAYRVMVHFYDYQLFRGKVKVYMLMVGLYTTYLNKLQDPTQIITNISLPLNPLLSQEYCTSLCEQIIGGPLTSAANSIVKNLWKRCLGIPRAIQVLHGVLNQFQNQLKASKISADVRKNILEEFTSNASSYFNTNVSLEENDFGLEQKVWHKELIELSLCVLKPQNAVIGNTNYNELEGKGIIFPVHFGLVEGNSATRAYTLPFHFFGAKLTNISAELWPSQASLQDFTVMSTTLGDIVGGDGAETNTSVQGDRLEKACAASIWARYQLKADNQYQYINMKDLVPNWSFDNHFVRLTGILTSPKQITVKPHKKKKNAKVKQDEASWTFDHLLPSLYYTQAIIINGKNSKFADVFVPVLALQNNELQQLKTLAQEVQSTSEDKLLQAEEQFKKLLLIQCKNVQPDNEDLKPAKIKKDFEAHHMEEVVASGHIFMILSPNLPSTSLDQRVSEHQQFFVNHKGKIIESNGADWLSELFILTYRLEKDAVTSNYLQKPKAQGKNYNNQMEDTWTVDENTSAEDKKEKPKSKAKKGQKRKADTQDEIDTSTGKKPKIEK